MAGKPEATSITLAGFEELPDDAPKKVQRRAYGQNKKSPKKIPASHPTLVARVAVDSPLPQLDFLFDYRVSTVDAPLIRPGVRVQVPLRNNNVSGFVVEVTSSSDFPGRLRQIKKLYSPLPVLSPEIWKLCRRVADRNAGVAADMLNLAIPSRVAKIEKEFLKQYPPETGAETPAEVPPIKSSFTNGFSAGGDDFVWEGGCRRSLIFSPGALGRSGKNSEKSRVAEWISVFAEAAAAVVASGRSALLVVPDFRDRGLLYQACFQKLTAQNTGSADIPLRLLSADDSPAERYRTFLESTLPRPQIVVGNRGALYAPLPSLGLIAVWDESHFALEEPRAPYPRARDIALLRQQHSGCRLLFASYAPSLGVRWLERSGWLESLRLPGRAPNLQVPREPGRLPPSTRSLIARALKRGAVLLQVPRKGFVTMAACVSCGELVRCPTCGELLGSVGFVPPALPVPNLEETARETAAREIAASGNPAGKEQLRLSCKKCENPDDLWSCPECGAAETRAVSRGADQTAAELRRAFPGYPVLVVTGDMLRPPVSTELSPTAPSPAELLSKQEDQEPKLVVSTVGAEPRISGGYAAVVILDAAALAFRSGPQALEQAVQSWAVAAAQAAAGAPVMVPGLPSALIGAFRSWQWEEFFVPELEAAEELHLPPAWRVAAVDGALPALELLLAKLSADGVGENISTVGPQELHHDGEPIRGRLIVLFPPKKTELVVSVIRAAMLRKEDAEHSGSLRVRCDDWRILDSVRQIAD